MKSAKIHDGCQILLLQSPIHLKAEDVSTFGLFPPLGLAYLASSLLPSGFTVSVRDLLAEGFNSRHVGNNGMVRIGMPESEIEEMLRRSDPTIIGISNNFTSFSQDSVLLARTVRRCLPNAVIVMGGAQASAEPDALLETGAIDAVVTGEGETTFRELAEHVRSGHLDEASRTPGTAWAVNGHIMRNGDRPPVENLDELPFPAYELLPMGKYLWQTHANFAFVMRRPVGHMITTRGCPFNCIFCSTSKHFKRFRLRSPQNVIAEMRHLIERYGIREFHFHDDNFTADPERVRALCEGILSAHIAIRWQVSQGVNANCLDEHLLKLMKKSGMYRIGFPIESGCPEVLRFIRKPLRLDHARSVIHTCNELGIYCFGCFMIGFPEETKEQIRQTEDFILHSGLDYAKISICQPLAGSDLYDIYRQHNLCNEGIEPSSTYFHTTFDTVHFSAGELNDIRAKIVREFSHQRLKKVCSLRGIQRWVLPKIQSWESFRYFVKVSTLALRGY